MSNIRYPIAINKKSRELVNASQESKDNSNEYLCFHCKSDMYVVNKKEGRQRPHFRHKSDAKCQANYETFIHWLAKEVFKDIKKIILPEIHYRDLNLNTEQKKKFDENIQDLFVKYKVPKEFQMFYYHDNLLQKKKEMEIDNYYIESTVQSDLGDFRVDIILEVNNVPFLIEPFYTNGIDDKKYNKIESSDCTTLAVNLAPFVRTHEFLFDLNDFVNFIKNNTATKKWIYLRNSKKENLMKKYLIGLETKFKRNQFVVNEYFNRESDISKLEDEKYKLQNQINSLNKEINKMKLNQGKLVFKFYEIGKN
jgi:hypothetical protein